MLSVYLLLLTLLITSSLCEPSSINSGLVIQTTSGEVHGFINKTTPLVRTFLGIPYAEPPLGELRFAPPQPVIKTGIINALSFAPSCMQQFSNSSTIYTAKVPQFLINGGQSEDCLYLNIWAPLTNNQGPQELALPVFVYIPGGGFTSGGANSPYKIPDKWIQRTQSHIVVIMKYELVAQYIPLAHIANSYRVNVFGFPNAKGLTDVNPGLLDQRKV